MSLSHIAYLEHQRSMGDKSLEKKEIGLGVQKPISSTTDIIEQIDGQINRSTGTKNGRHWVDQLGLKQHPFMEEVYFRETFVDTQVVQVKGNNNNDTKNQRADDFAT